jgi:SsrA-binding protein
MKKTVGKIIAENRRARFDYEITEKFEAGIELQGHEVKSAKSGQMGLNGSYAVIQKNSLRPTRRTELWLLNASIPPYQPKNTPVSYDPARSRRLLLNASEIAKLAGRVKEKYIIVPLQAEIRHGLVKIILGVARPRKTRDKREYLKKRDAQKEMRQI